MAKKLLQRRELREMKPARMSAAMGGLDPPPTGPGRWEVGGGRWEVGGGSWASAKPGTEGTGERWQGCVYARFPFIQTFFPTR